MQKKKKPKGDTGSREKRKAGRPTLYNEQVGKAVCELITQGYTLRQIGELSNMPDKSTIIRWLSIHDEFRDQYARAHETRALVMADEVLEIADDNRNDWVERENKDGTTYVELNDEAIQRSRMRIETRKWWMGKANPKRFGEKVQHANDPDNPMPAASIGVVVLPPKQVSDGSGT